MILDKNQRDLLARVTALYGEYKTAEAASAARRAAFERQEQRDLEALLQKAATAAAEAVNGGVPKRRIALDAMGQKGTIAAYKLLEMVSTPALTASPEILVVSGEFVVDPDTGNVQVTPPRALLSPSLANWGQTEESLDAHPSLRTATFDADGNAITPGFDLETGRHPVVAYVLGNPAYRRKIQEAAA